MSHMQPEILFGNWWQVETTAGTEFVLEDDVDGSLGLQDFLEGTIADEPELIEGYGARLSAPGYLDCTDWRVFETEDEAREYLEETYGDLTS